MSEYLIRIVDYQGVEVVLERSVWMDKVLHPVIGHPEVKDYIDEIKLAIQSPEVVYASLRDVRSKLFYRSDLTRGRFQNHWLVVVVKYVREPGGLVGYVSTIFIARALKKRGDRLWPKLQN